MSDFVDSEEKNLEVTVIKGLNDVYIKGQKFFKDGIKALVVSEIDQDLLGTCKSIGEYIKKKYFKKPDDDKEGDNKEPEGDNKEPEGDNKEPEDDKEGDNKESEGEKEDDKLPYNVIVIISSLTLYVSDGFKFEDVSLVALSNVVVQIKPKDIEDDHAAKAAQLRFIRSGIYVVNSEDRKPVIRIEGFDGLAFEDTATFYECGPKNQDGAYLVDGETEIKLCAIPKLAGIESLKFIQKDDEGNELLLSVTGLIEWLKKKNNVYESENKDMETANLCFLSMFNAMMAHPKKENNQNIDVVISDI